MFGTVFWGVMIPFFGTAFGAACVFFMRHKINETWSGCLCGFAAGIMTAASVWSLLIPAMEQMHGMGRLAFLPAVAGFWAGVVFLCLLDVGMPKKNKHDGTCRYPA